MKKIIIPTSIISFVVIVVIVFLFTVKDEKQFDENITNESLFAYENLDATNSRILTLLSINSYEDLYAKAEDFSVTFRASEDESVVFADGLKVLDTAIEVFAQFNEAKELVRLDGKFGVNCKNSQEADAVIAKVCAGIKALFPMLNSVNYRCFAPEGYQLFLTESEIGEKIFNDGAIFSFSLIDFDMSYWMIKGYIDENNDFYFEFFHSYQVDIYEFLSGNVDADFSDSVNDETNENNEESIATEYEEGYEAISDVQDTTAEETEEITAVEEYDENI